MPIEQVSPELERIVSLDQEVEELGSGYRVGEGPLWWQEGGYLLFSEVRGNRRRKWAPGEGVTVLQEPTNNANGLTRDPQGRLIMCEGGTRRVTRMEPDGVSQLWLTAIMGGVSTDRMMWSSNLTGASTSRTRGDHPRSWTWTSRECIACLQTWAVSTCW